MMRGQHAEEREYLIGGVELSLRKHSLRKKRLTSALHDLIDRGSLSSKSSTSTLGDCTWIFSLQE